MALELLILPAPPIFNIKLLFPGVMSYINTE